jgi:hypothetical protein
LKKRKEKCCSCKILPETEDDKKMIKISFLLIGLLFIFGLLFSILIEAFYIGFTLSYWITLVFLGILLHTKNVETNFAWDCSVFGLVFFIIGLLASWTYWYLTIEDMDAKFESFQ